MNKLFNIYVYIILTMLISSCSTNGKAKGNSISKVENLITQKTSSKKILYSDEKSIFLEALFKDRENISDSIRAIKVVESNFYSEASSDMNEYVPIFNYLLEHFNEEYDESVSVYLYSMLTKYPSKFIEFEHYLNYLPADKQLKLLNAVFDYVNFEFAYQYQGGELDEMIDLYAKTFPFLAKYEMCIDNLKLYINIQ